MKDKNHIKIVIDEVYLLTRLLVDVNNSRVFI